MSTMNRRVQVLMDERRYSVLEREARRTGRSVADLIRECVDRAYGVDHAQRRAALDVILSAAPMPVGTWEEERDMLDSMRGFTR